MSTIAEKLESLADRLQDAIDHARRPMTQNPTPKRNREYQGRLHDAGNLERTQQALRALASAHRAGSVPPILAGLKSKSEIAQLVHKSTVSHGYYHVATADEYLSKTPAALAMQHLMECGTTDEERKESEQRKASQEVERAKADLGFQRIPGYFPTPADVARRLVLLAGIEPGHRVLEPSAGTGAIIDAIREHSRECTIFAIEINHTMVDVLKQTAFAPGKADHRIAIRCEDFLESNGDLGLFDRIVMNPPFDRGADVKHIKHALGHLREGGRLVSVCAAGPKQREAMEEIATSWETLPPGSFKESGTGVAAAIVVIDK